METAELVLVNGRIFSGRRGTPVVEALAVKDSRIVAMGSNDEVRALAGDATEVRDLGGATVFPGFGDVHSHHIYAGQTDLFELSFSSTTSYEQILDLVREYAAKLRPDEWMLGGSIGSTVFEEIGNVNARLRMDEAAGGRPVCLHDDSHHNRYVNTRALELAGISKETPEPAGGQIVRDPSNGEPTGLLVESATAPVLNVISRTQPLTLQMRTQACRRAIEILNGYGITAIQDAGVSTNQLSAIHTLDEAEGLHAWVVSSLLVNDFVFGESPIGDDLIAQREQFRSAHHRPDFIKIFLDGVPPTCTGAFLTPYRQDAGHANPHFGKTTMDQQELEDWLLRTAKLGLSAKIHCTGDASVRSTLDAIHKVREQGFDTPKYQIAHGQFVHPDDRPRFAELRVTADISPFLWFPGVLTEAIDNVRPAQDVGHLHPNRSLIDAGALVAGGSDWPVSESPNPWEGIQGLVTRQDPLGRAEGTLWPEQAVTLDEAIEIFTINPARAMGVDDVTGSLEAGKSADFIVLNQNPLEIDVTELINTRAEQTWFAGKLVFEAH